MTQEELDALMSGDVGDLDEASADSGAVSNADSAGDLDPKNYRADATKTWPPPPPSSDHKVVSQLDDVTKDSEVKASELFDQLDAISVACEKAEKKAASVSKRLENTAQMVEKLSQKFPKITSFNTALEDLSAVKNELKELKEAAADAQDACMNAMDMMQYQDIHRQKIERVINVMRALAQYMNSLFEGKIDDSKRVSSAVYIEGDENADAASNEELEALIASFGKK